jgi:hypothetical protein
MHAALVDPPINHREAITSRLLLLQAIGQQTSHAGRTTLTITSSHGDHHRALTRIASFFAELRSSCAVERWYRILSQALIKYLRRRQRARADSDEVARIPLLLIFWLFTTLLRTASPLFSGRCGAGNCAYNERLWKS